VVGGGVVGVLVVEVLLSLAGSAVEEEDEGDDCDEGEGAADADAGCGSGAQVDSSVRGRR
jgi:hypothetical protein